MKSRIFTLLTPLLLTATTGFPVFAADTSQTISFGGCDPALTGTVDLRLRLFDASVAGNRVYQETQPSVAVDSAGCFSVLIGSVTALSTELFTANPSLWVAFALEASPDIELGGRRTPLASSGYAFRARIADNAQSLPGGSVIVADQLGPGLTIENPNPTGNGLQATGGNVGLSGNGGLVGALGRATAVGGRGVVGVSEAATGVSFGVTGTVNSSTAGAAGVYGRSAASGNTFGVLGESSSTNGGRGVLGNATATSGDAVGVWGGSESSDGFGIVGIVARGTQSSGVRAISLATDGNGLIAEAHNGGSAYALWAKSNNGFAGVFDGKVRVNGNMTARVVEILGGADLSEKFEVRGGESKVEPGMVVVIDPSSPGKLAVSTRAHDRRVVGILSGAGGVAPGMLMGQAGTLADGDHAVALSGRVYVWADASGGPIVSGDLLTTSNIPGHAMKVKDYGQAQGTVLGKAMTGLEKGRGLVLTVVTLQ
jgi:hypothetical protein